VAISPAQAKRERAALLRAIARAEKDKNRAELLRLRELVRTRKRERGKAIVVALSRCAARRAVPTQKTAIEWQRQAKRDAKSACDLARGQARALRDPVKKARAAAEAEQTYQRDLRRIERGIRRKGKETRPGIRRAVERRAESDDEVRASIPPELALLFEKVKRSIKGSDRESRTEAFLRYAEEHPDEELAAIEDRTDAVIAELERRQAMPNPKKKKKTRKTKRSKGRPPSCPRARPARAPTRPRLNPRKRPPAGSVKQGDLFMAPSGQLVLVEPSHEQRVRERKASAASRTVPMFERAKNPKRTRARTNPKRPPRRWFDRCLRSVTARKYARDPAAVCAAAWWRRPPAERERIVRRLERGSARERRTAVAIARAEARRADGPPRKRNPGMSDAEARAEYERTHWGDRGRDRVQSGRAANPAHGTATQMGALYSVTYETRKGGDSEAVLYEHEFSRSRPKLAYNAGGLLIVGGDYTVKKGGITG
jgi:hypothetical protein